MEWETATFELDVVHTNEAKREYLIAELSRELRGVADEAHEPGAVDETRLVLETLVITVAASSTLVLANAVRDFVKRQRVTLSIKRGNGDHIVLEASGSDLSDVSELVGFLEGGHTKTIKEARSITEEKHSKSASLRLSASKEPDSE